MGLQSQKTVVGGVLPVSMDVHCESIKDVLPLDAQKGVYPPKTVCDALLDPLFGQPDPTEDEIVVFGSRDAVPDMNTYAIIDAAKIAQGREVIGASGLPHRCLLKGEVAEELGDVLPYLVALDPKARFTRTLFTHATDVPAEMGTVHLCHKEPGIYIRSRASFDEVWSQLRKFTRVQDHEGRWYFFRFWEGRNLGGVLGNMQQSQLNSFFRHAKQVISVHNRDGSWICDVYSLRAH